MSWVVAIICIIMWFDLKGRLRAIEEEMRRISKRSPSTTPDTPATAPYGKHVVPTNSHKVSHDTHESQLDDVVAATTGEEVSAIVHTPTTQIPQADPVTSVYADKHTEYHQNQADSTLDHFVAWLKMDFLVKLGAALLLLAFGWFIIWMISNGLISPVMQVACGLLIAASVMTLGVWRMQAYSTQGGIFLALGATGIFLTVIAAHEAYNFFDPFSSMLIAGVTIGIVSVMSVKYRRLPLAYGGLLLGSISPVLFGFVYGLSDLWLMSYLLLLSAGTLWVVWVTGWTGLILASLIVVYMYSLGQLLVSPSLASAFFSFLFVALYFMTNMISLVRRHGHGEHHKVVHTAVALGTALFLFSWVSNAIPDAWQSAVYVLWALAFAGGTYVIYNFTAHRAAFYLYGTVAAILIGIATAEQFSGSVLVIMYTLEAVGFVVASALMIRRPTVPAYAAWLLTLPTLLALPSLEYRLWDGALGIEWVQWVLLTVAFGAVVLILHSLQPATEPEPDRVTTTRLFFTGFCGVACLYLIWATAHTILPYTTAVTVALVIYTLIGVVMVVVGQRFAQTTIGRIGMGLIALVIGRLVLFDMQSWSQLERIVTYFLIGLLLVSTAFVNRTKKDV